MRACASVFVYARVLVCLRGCGCACSWVRAWVCVGVLECACACARARARARTHVGGWLGVSVGWLAGVTVCERQSCGSNAQASKRTVADPHLQ